MKQIEDDPKKKGQDSETDSSANGHRSDKEPIAGGYSQSSGTGIIDDTPTTEYDSAIPNITDIFDFPKDFGE